MLLLATVLGTQVMSAQQQKEGKRPERKRMTREQMYERKANRLAENLALDDKTAEKFKATYTKYMEEMQALWKKDMPQKPEAGKEGEQVKKERKALTDAEVEKMIKERFEQSRKMLDIREKYYEEFRKFLSPKQIQKVYDSEMNDKARPRKEMNRRAGMMPPKDGQRPPMPQGGEPRE